MNRRKQKMAAQRGELGWKISRCFAPLFALLLAFTGCGVKSADQSQPAQNPSADTINLDGSYGTLSYKGLLQRSVEGTNCKYSIKELHVKYHLLGSINSTAKIPLTIELVATKPPASGDGPWERIFEKAYTTTEVLTFTSPNATLTNLVFLVPPTWSKKPTTWDSMLRMEPCCGRSMRNLNPCRTPPTQTTIEIGTHALSVLSAMQ